MRSASFSPSLGIAHQIEIGKPGDSQRIAQTRAAGAFQVEDTFGKLGPMPLVERNYQSSLVESDATRARRGGRGSRQFRATARAWVWWSATISR